MFSSARFRGSLETLPLFIGWDFLQDGQSKPVIKEYNCHILKVLNKLMK